MFNAGEIIGKLKLDRSGFTAGMLEANTITSMLGTSIGTFLANPLLGVANLAKEAAMGIIHMAEAGHDYIGEIRRFKIETGISAEAAAGLGHAAAMAGTDLGSLQQMLSRMVNSAQTGSPAFATLNVQTRDLHGNLRPMADLLEAVAMGLGQVGNATERAALANDIFGRGGMAMLPFLAKVKDGFAGVTEEARRAGLVISEEAERSAVALTRAQRQLAESKKALNLAASEALDPTFAMLYRVAGRTLNAVRTGDDMQVVWNAPLLLAGVPGAYAFARRVDPGDQDAAAPAIQAATKMGRAQKVLHQKSVERAIDQHDFEAGLTNR